MDLFESLDPANPPDTVPSEVPADESGDGARRDALSRQRRTGVLMGPFRDVEVRQRLQYASVEGGPVDVEYLLITMLDYVSERMVSAMSVPQAEIVDTVAGHARESAPGLDEATARKLATKLVDELSNREDRLRPFRVEFYCPKEQGRRVRDVRYLAYEDGGVPSWRLTEDGMRVTLRVLDLKEDDEEDLSHVALRRAIERRNISEIERHANIVRQECIRRATLLKVRIRDALTGLSSSWSDLSEDLEQARGTMDDRKADTLDIAKALDALLDEVGRSVKERAQLERARLAIENVSDAYSALNTEMMRVHDGFEDAMVRRMRLGAASLMPDLFADVLVPMLALPIPQAATMVAELGESVARPPPPRRFLDLHAVCDEVSMAIQKMVGEKKLGPDEDEDQIRYGEEDPDSIEEHAKARATALDLFVERGPMALSEFTGIVMSAEGVTFRQKTAMVMEAMTATTPEYEVSPLDRPFRHDGVLWGDDVMIGAKR